MKHTAIVHSRVKHFADDTNILYSSKSLTDLNKKVNHDITKLVQWLRANRISLNVKKTDIIIFRPPGKTITKKLNFRVSGQKIQPTTHTKYLGVTIDEHLSLKSHVDSLRQKLSRSNGLLAKLRYYVSPSILRSVYFAIFDSRLRYSCQVWGQSSQGNISCLKSLQDKALRIMNFKMSRDNCEQLYHSTSILKFSDMINFYNSLLPFDQLKESLPEAFDFYFQSFRDIHQYQTRGAQEFRLNVPRVNTAQYGSKSVKYQCIISWNNTLRFLGKSPNDINHFQFSNLMKNHFLNQYE